MGKYVFENSILRFNVGRICSGSSDLGGAPLPNLKELVLRVIETGIVIKASKGETWNIFCLASSISLTTVANKFFPDGPALR